jgi:short-subunit dehydrogenase involved in D-alanine esterification of teichoic acids
MREFNVGQVRKISVYFDSTNAAGPDWSDPESIDIKTTQLEFNTNYFAYLALTKELIPFLRKKDQQTALIYISSNLALVPIPPRSNYCATKAALHQWILSLRVSLQSTNIKVVEVYPPAVQTELHDEKHQPDIKNGRSMGMPLDEFTESVSSSTSDTFGAASY